jgi:hypothetical protein
MKELSVVFVIQMCCSQYTRGLCGVCSDLCSVVPPTVLPCGLTSAPDPTSNPSPPFRVDNKDDQGTITNKVST